MNHYDFYYPDDFLKKSMNAIMKVKESQKNKTPTVKLNISSTFVEYSSELSKKSNDLIINMIWSCYGFVCNTASIGGQERHVVTTVIAFDLDGAGYAFIVVFDPDESCMVRIDLVLVWLHMCFLLCINNTVLVFKIVFGGDTEFRSVVEVLDEYGEILRREQISQRRRNRLCDHDFRSRRQSAFAVEVSNQHSNFK
jgi:hypothetical protein